jgi:predicted TIM-barrel fold metal-dependent hydrolase
MKVIDAHLHVQPWEQVKPDALAKMQANRANLDEVRAAMERPSVFLKMLDRAGVEAAVLVNYVAPDVMGFSDTVNEWVANYCQDHTDRLIAMGSVHPLYQKPPGAEVQRLHDMGIRALKIHPPHQCFPVNAYRTGEIPGLAPVYAKAEQLGMPVMIHTGTSIFEGARNVYADPMAVDDVAVDFPNLTIILAHAGRPLYMETGAPLPERPPRHLEHPAQAAAPLPARPGAVRGQDSVRQRLAGAGRARHRHQHRRYPRPPGERGSAGEDPLLQRRQALPCGAGLGSGPRRG